MTQTPDSDRRSVELSRLAEGHYRARNADGAEVDFGRGDGLLTPVELLLAAIAGCSSVDLDTATSRSSEPDEFRVAATGRKVVEDGASRMDDINLSFNLSFPDDDAGRKAASMVQRLVALSHDKYCTVSRTVEHGAPVTYDANAAITGADEG